MLDVWLMTERLFNCLCRRKRKCRDTLHDEDKYLPTRFILSLMDHIAFEAELKGHYVQPQCKAT